VQEKVRGLAVRKRKKKPLPAAAQVGVLEVIRIGRIGKEKSADEKTFKNVGGSQAGTGAPERPAGKQEE